jgi:uncharacterized RDD family membrane protein YckC
VPAWKQELNERLAATRSRRMRIRGEQVALPRPNSRAAKLAAKVARRYANAPSYSEVLAAEGRARTEKEEAAQAVRNTASIPIRRVEQPSEPRHESLPAEAKHEAVEFEVLATEIEEPVTAAPQLGSASATGILLDEPEQPVFYDGVEPLATNVIDFPRELVASRKLRPRLAEGPLSVEDEKSQLRIFEVSPQSISQTASVGPAKDWAPIRLDPPAESTPRNQKHARAEEIPLQAAPLEDRIMATIFDFALIVAAFALFVLVFAACTSHPPAGKPALLGASIILLGFCLLYQFLFFKFAGCTPGMRYARIALCTFDDENPTRKAMCRRVWFQLLSAAPLGLGFAWAWFDTDRLGWHDRMSRIYQRSYS